MVDIYRASNFDETEAARLQVDDAESEPVEAETKPVKRAATKVVKPKAED